MDSIEKKQLRYIQGKSDEFVRNIEKTYKQAISNEVLDELGCKLVIKDITKVWKFDIDKVQSSFSNTLEKGGISDPLLVDLIDEFISEVKKFDKYQQDLYSERKYRTYKNNFNSIKRFENEILPSFKEIVRKLEDIDTPHGKEARDLFWSKTKWLRIFFLVIFELIVLSQLLTELIKLFAFL